MRSYGRILWAQRQFHDIYDESWSPIMDNTSGNTGMWKKGKNKGLCIHAMVEVPVRILDDRKGMRREEVLDRVKFAFERWFDDFVRKCYDGIDDEYDYTVRGMDVTEAIDGVGYDWVMTIEMSMTPQLYLKVNPEITKI